MVYARGRINYGRARGRRAKNQERMKKEMRRHAMAPRRAGQDVELEGFELEDTCEGADGLGEGDEVEDGDGHQGSEMIWEASPPFR